MSLRVIAFALAVACAAPAFAQDAMSKVADVGAGSGSGNRGAMKACKADVQTYCGGVEKGGGRIKACMMQHAASLSPGCKSALQTMRAARKDK
jgi:hypothetical protein